jgi:NAD(P)-dependent dehydrogenase (short-subunit alcohol dehydrogenase family)
MKSSTTNTGTKQEALVSSEFSGKVAIVTGAGGGIGLATAKAFAKAGASVVIAEIQDKLGEEAARGIIAEGGQAVYIHTDVSHAKSVATLITRTVQAYGSVDYAVNNAGIDPEVVPEASWDEHMFDKIIGVNLKGVFLCMKYELAQMEKQGGGVIVNVASIAGLTAVYNKPSYTASKHGVIGMTKAASLQYARKNIRINAMCPGGVDTPITEQNHGGSMEFLAKMNDAHPIGRISGPEEIAAGILYQCSEGASFMIGHALVLDGGLTAG